MSQVPKNVKPKYNKNEPWRWVDGQLEKFMTEQIELKKKILELEKENEQLKLKLTFGTPTDGLEVGSPEDYGEKPWIYESPDGGKTVYRRRTGNYDEKELVTNTNQLNLFDDNKHS